MTARQHCATVATYRGGASFLSQFDGNIASDGGHRLGPPGAAAAARPGLFHGFAPAPLLILVPLLMPLPVLVRVRVRVVPQQAATLAS